MSENINPESVDGITLADVTELLRAWNAIEAGSTKALPLAAPSIARAYLALSERVGELVEFIGGLECWCGIGNTKTCRRCRYVEEFAALSHKGMDHG